MMDFNDLHWFFLVVKHKSFVAAATQLNVSKSVVSKYISRLEKNLGVQLLVRTTRKLELTPIGYQVYQKALNMHDEMEQIKHLSTSYIDVPEGKLRINAPYGLGQTYLIPAISAFMKKFPSISIELLLGSHLFELIDDTIDLALCVQQPQKLNTVIKKIMNYRVHICASPHYLKKYSVPQNIHDLKQHNCLVYKSLKQAHPWYFYDGKGNETKMMVSGNFSANNSRALLNAALSDVGIVKLPSYVVQTALNDGQLISILEEYCQHDNGIYIARASTSYLPKKTRLFIDFITNYFQHYTI